MQRKAQNKRIARRMRKNNSQPNMDIGRITRQLQVLNDRLPPVEEKFVLTNSNVTPVYGSPVSILVSTIAAGTTQNQRVGSSLKLRHYVIRGNINFNASATTSQFRMILT